MSQERPGQDRPPHHSPAGDVAGGAFLEITETGATLVAGLGPHGTTVSINDLGGATAVTITGY